MLLVSVQIPEDLRGVVPKATLIKDARIVKGKGEAKEEWPELECQEKQRCQNPMQGKVRNGELRERYFSTGLSRSHNSTGLR